jgi:hypothetical protein
MGKMQFLRPDSAKQLILLKKASSASVPAVLGRCEIFLSNIKIAACSRRTDGG